MSKKEFIDQFRDKIEVEKKYNNQKMSNFKKAFDENLKQIKDLDRPVPEDFVHNRTCLADAIDREAFLYALDLFLDDFEKESNTTPMDTSENESEGNSDSNSANSKKEMKTGFYKTVFQGSSVTEKYGTLSLKIPFHSDGGKTHFHKAVEMFKTGKYCEAVFTFK